MYQYTDDKGLFVDILPVDPSNPNFEKAASLREELIS
jgi:hypothetical protein